MHAASGSRLEVLRPESPVLGKGSLAGSSWYEGIGGRKVLCSRSYYAKEELVWYVARTITLLTWCYFQLTPTRLLSVSLCRASSRVCIPTANHSVRSFDRVSQAKVEKLGW